MGRDRSDATPGGLWATLVRRTELAQQQGALEPIATCHRIIEQAGVRFVVRMATKGTAGGMPVASAGPGIGPAGERPDGAPVDDPFRCPDPALVVADISASHVGLLNKFAVLRHHLLIVTRGFEAQECLLTQADLMALATCLGQIDGLGFYNGGWLAGASQVHKHLQLVPLPLVDDSGRLPVEALLGASGAMTPPSADQDRFGTLPGLPFRHVFAWLDRAAWDDPARIAGDLQRRYLAMLARLGIHPLERAGERRQSAPYNLLITRDWLLLVARRRDAFLGVPVNALGFAGSLFVRDAAQLKAVETAGPMSILAGVAVVAP